MSISLPFLSKKIYKTSSRYNDDIRVVSRGKTISLYVNGIQQAGPYDSHVFDRAFNAFHIEKLHPKNMLLLGVGGGYVIKKAKSLWPNVSIDAIDIDISIIDIAQTYFDISIYEKINYIVSDAHEYVKKSVVQKKHYDFIVVDLYIGDTIPSFVDTEAFLLNLKLLTYPNGHTLINYQDLESYKERRLDLETTLTTIFPLVDSSAVFEKYNREYLLSF